MTAKKDESSSLVTQMSSPRWCSPLQFFQCLVKGNSLKNCLTNIFSFAGLSPWTGQKARKIKNLLALQVTKNNFHFASVCSCWKTHFCKGRLPGVKCQEKRGFALVNWMHWSIKYNQDLWQNPLHADISPWWWRGRGWGDTVWWRGPILWRGHRGKVGSQEPGLLPPVHRAALKDKTTLGRGKSQPVCGVLTRRVHKSLESGANSSVRSNVSLSFYVCCRLNLCLVLSDSGV